MKYRIALQCYGKIELEVIHLAAGNPSLSNAGSTSSHFILSFGAVNNNTQAHIQCKLSHRGRSYILMFWSITYNLAFSVLQTCMILLTDAVCGDVGAVCTHQHTVVLTVPSLGGDSRWILLAHTKEPEKSNIIIYFYLNSSNLGKDGELHQFPIKLAHFDEYQFVSWCTVLEKQKINTCTHIQMSPTFYFESNNCFLFFSLFQWVINTMPYRERHLHNMNIQQY